MDSNFFEDFRKALFDPQGDGVHDLSRQIKNAEITAERMQIYQNGFEIRTRETLERAYPFLKTAMGETEWFRLGRDFVYSRAQSLEGATPNLNQLPFSFPDYLLEQSVSAEWIQIAHFELEILATSQKPLHRGLNSKQFDLSRIEEATRFRLISSLSLCEAPEACLRFWSDKISVDASFGVDAHAAAIFRMASGVGLSVLNETQAVLLALLGTQASLEEAVRESEINAEDLQSLFSKAIQFHWVEEIAARGDLLL